MMMMADAVRSAANDKFLDVPKSIQPQGEEKVKMCFMVKEKSRKAANSRLIYSLGYDVNMSNVSSRKYTFQNCLNFF